MKERTNGKSTPSWHAGFLALLPAVKKQAAISFRHLRPDAKEEAISEAVVVAPDAQVRMDEACLRGDAIDETARVHEIRINAAAMTHQVREAQELVHVVRARVRENQVRARVNVERARERVERARVRLEGIEHIDLEDFEFEFEFDEDFDFDFDFDLEELELELGEAHDLEIEDRLKDMLRELEERLERLDGEVGT